MAATAPLTRSARTGSNAAAKQGRAQAPAAPTAARQVVRPTSTATSTRADVPPKRAKGTVATGTGCAWTGLICSGVCVARGSVGEGGACSRNGVCAQGLQCVDDTCAMLTIRQSGEACSLGGEGFNELCAAGSVCTNLTVDAASESLIGTCAAPKQVGGTCNINFECALGLRCNAESIIMPGTCEEAASAGGSCDEFSDCASLDCDDGVCAEPEVDPHLRPAVAVSALRVAGKLPFHERLKSLRVLAWEAL